MSDSSMQLAEKLMNDPIGLFDGSITKMHMIPRDELESIQRTAVSKRFREHYNSIEMLRTLADQVGVTEVNELDDLIPLLLPHTVFKSYPASILSNKRFDLLTKWLDQLTSYDLSKIDISECSSIEEWIDLLDEHSPLRVSMSSGTTGTVSLIPRSALRTKYNIDLWKAFFFQQFGKEPTEDDLSPDVEVIWPNYASGKLGHLRWAEVLKTAFTGGDESKFHPLYSGSIDADLMLLSSQMRAAASKGLLDDLKIDPKLLARKDEFEEMRDRKPEEMARFFEKCTTDLKGERVFMMSAYPLMYDVAAAGLERGVKGVFAKNSAILTGGGSKNVALPENFMDTIKEFLGVDRIQEGYGMSEVGALHPACEHGRYHIQPWTVLFLLDPDTGKALPRQGVVTGRAAFYDVLNESYWGGVISGDEITVDWDTPCPCGLSSVHIDHSIVRYSDKKGVEDDRIICAATDDVHNEAIEFMKEFEG